MAICVFYFHYIGADQIFYDHAQQDSKMKSSFMDFMMDDVDQPLHDEDFTNEHETSDGK